MLERLLGMLTGRMRGGQMGSLLGPLSGLLGSGGLAALLNKFTAAGMSGKASTWVSKEANQKPTAREVRRALGDDEIGRIAREAGVSKRQAASGLSELIPDLVDKATPDGEVPADDSGFDLDKLKSMLGL